MEIAHAVALAVVISVVTTGIGAYFLSRHLQSRRRFDDDLSPVTRQHIELFQGGQLNESALESAKRRYRILLERGEFAAVEASLRPGMQYIVQVRALAEIGTDDAGRILERQLQRRLTEDQIEQSWYWIDLASGLRSLNREQSLPHLLRCAEKAGDIPLGHFFAAETVCFLGFSGYLRQLRNPLGRAAMRVLHRTLEGLRYGLQPHVVVEGRLGEVIENLWDNRPETVEPLMVRILYESLRLLRRVPHAEAALADEPAEQEAFQWQIARVSALEPTIQDYLHDAPRHMCKVLKHARGPNLSDLLRALSDLRADVAADILPLLAKSQFPYVEEAVEVLRWSSDPRVGFVLRDWVAQHVPILRRAQKRKRASAPSRRSIPAHVPYQAILRSLKGHPCRETEAFLLLASQDCDPTFRLAAISSMGWWEPVNRRSILNTLQDARYDPNSEVRMAARAALARLGERQALQWFRQGLNSEEPQRVHETIQVAGSECITLLWPDLDGLADSEDSDLAHFAREAVERLSEDLDYRKV